ncbi:MAG: hypothetical protein H0W08_08420 [Acidobacteria bacterium]|nr:hypothetical protein [Acidobacteriota bacterium]
MSDRKYRQRGYQDEPREPRHTPAAPPKKDYTPRGQPPIAPKTFSMPGFREIVRCKGCGYELTVATAWSTDGICVRCGVALHSCAQCAHFDSSAPFECQQTIPARISPKDARNECQFFQPRTTVERETKSTPSGGGISSAKQAFDDLFK